MKKTIITIVVIVAILFAVIMPSYNNLVNLNEDVDNAWSQVQVAVKRRADLIPNLVNTVKGYANFEEETLTKITEARSKVNSANTPEELASANEQLTRAIGDINVVVEAYPDLKAQSSFLDLQAQLEGTENRIATARRDYNEEVKVYNKKVRSLPTKLYAGLLGFGPKAYFEAPEGEQDAPDVNF